MAVTALFQRTVARNNELEIRVEELERELSVWKAALKTADEDKKTLSKTVVQLERSIGSLRVCLLQSCACAVELTRGPFRMITHSSFALLTGMATSSLLNF